MLFYKKFDLIVSIGEDCACAGYLRQLNLRTFSSPFDWVDGSTIYKRLNLIRNNFEGWLDVKYIEKLYGKEANDPIKYMELNPNISPNDVHESYINTVTGIKFHHDFVYKTPFEENIHSVKEKYDRRISRFMKSVKNANKICLVFFAKNNFNVLECQECLKKLNTKYNNKFYLLCIENNDMLAINDVIIEKTQNMTHVQINNSSVDCSTDFTKLMGNIPVVKQIIINTVFEFNVLELVKYSKDKRCILYKIQKFFINFIPNKKIRKELREKLTF